MLTKYKMLIILGYFFKYVDVGIKELSGSIGLLAMPEDAEKLEDDQTVR